MHTVPPLSPRPVVVTTPGRTPPLGPVAPMYTPFVATSPAAMPLPASLPSSLPPALSLEGVNTLPSAVEYIAVPASLAQIAGPLDTPPMDPLSPEMWLPPPRRGSAMGNRAYAGHMVSPSPKRSSTATPSVLASFGAAPTLEEVPSVSSVPATTPVFKERHDVPDVPPPSRLSAYEKESVVTPFERGGGGGGGGSATFERITTVSYERGSMVEAAAELRKNLDKVKELEYAAGLAAGGRSPGACASAGRKVTLSPPLPQRRGSHLRTTSPPTNRQVFASKPRGGGGAPTSPSYTPGRSENSVIPSSTSSEGGSSVDSEHQRLIVSLRSQLEQSEQMCASLRHDKLQLQRDLRGEREREPNTTYGARKTAHLTPERRRGGGGGGGTSREVSPQRQRGSGSGGVGVDDEAELQSLLAMRDRLSSATELTKSALRASRR